MGDRGGTATMKAGCHLNRYYTRWEIGGEPQHMLDVSDEDIELYPMGDRGGTATLMPSE